MKNNLIFSDYHIIHSKMNNISMTLIICALTTFLAGISYYILQIILSLEKRLDEIDKELKENIKNEKRTIATLKKKLDGTNKELEENIENEKRTTTKLNAFLDNYKINYCQYEYIQTKLNDPVIVCSCNYEIKIWSLKLLKALNIPIKLEFNDYISNEEFKYLEGNIKIANIPTITLIDEYNDNAGIVKYIVPVYVVASILDAEILSYNNYNFKKSFDTFVGRNCGYEFGKLNNACDIDEVKLLFI